jgi:hypothetical protein
MKPNSINKMAEHQLDHSLTSMEWLYRISNKQILDSKNIIDPNNRTLISETGLFSKFPDSINKNEIDTSLIDRLTNSSLNNNHNNIIFDNLKTEHAKINHSTALRAEPHRPVDLNAEYKGNDHARREGKPPYSYVNLITFAINSTPKKRMTLNEIYQWISENFHYYRKAGNGWKVNIKYSKIS